MTDVESAPSADNQPKKQKKDEKLTLKSVLTKMVPYASFPYAEHALRLCEVDPNLKADPNSET